MARKVGIVGHLFKNHSAIIERNNHGHTVIVYAKEEKGLRLYRTREVDKITNKVSEKIGWDTTERSKSHAIDTLSSDLEGAMCVLHSAETYGECRTFVHGERGKMAGFPGKLDDRVMALALANIAAGRPGIGNTVF